ncbi:hypothetical protein SAMN05444166_1876 [Singulisphaera sp. GP187]|uniref:hypothetical protein n=1 Tax=Singulisphaera sp. GP187 TaxID=1882752 RepID=UPI0009271A34|nr:hypothetical protein [Singulisphaera sp. GP187]SIN97753.1 hypothetical protein SAMN05444166_1876 [Singulisphaera sp. GP187]
MVTRYVRYWAAGALACFVSGFLSAAFLDWLHGPTLTGGAQAGSTASNPWIQFFGTLCGALVGGGFLIVGQQISWKSQHGLKAKEIEERREQRWAEFQMKTLLELQQAVQNLVQAISILHFIAIDYKAQQKNEGDLTKSIHEFELSILKMTGLMLLVESPAVRQAAKKLFRNRPGITSRFHAGLGRAR